MRIIVTLIIGAAALVSAGCASNRGTTAPEAALATAPSCCASPRDFPFEAAESDERIAFSIDERSSAYPFASGRSFFKAFALAESPQPVTATTVSFADMEQSTLGGWTGRYFAPVVVFYDAVFKAYGPFQGVPDFLFDGRGRWFTALRTPIPPHARYMVVMTDARLLHDNVRIPAVFRPTGAKTQDCASAAGSSTAAAGAMSMETLCGLFAGAPVYAPAAKSGSSVPIPYSAGGDLALWLSPPAAGAPKTEP